MNFQILELKTCNMIMKTIISNRVEKMIKFNIHNKIKIMIQPLEMMINKLMINNSRENKRMKLIIKLQMMLLINKIIIKQFKKNISK